jgi:hypothetical protein
MTNTFFLYTIPAFFLFILAIRGAMAFWQDIKHLIKKQKSKKRALIPDYGTCGPYDPS